MEGDAAMPYPGRTGKPSTGQQDPQTLNHIPAYQNFLDSLYGGLWRDCGHAISRAYQQAITQLQAYQ